VHISKKKPTWKGYMCDSDSVTFYKKQNYGGKDDWLPVIGGEKDEPWNTGDF
jgi:hypothetical protein